LAEEVKFTIAWERIQSMNLIKEFEEWLVVRNKNSGSTLSVSSAYKYARAIKTISDDMITNGLFDKIFYTNSSLQELKVDIALIKNNDFFISKNKIGHNMYSVALDHFISFLQEKNN
jgi:hypothetical protein